jgi:putative NADPH-quinone reductase
MQANVILVWYMLVIVSMPSIMLKGWSDEVYEFEDVFENMWIELYFMCFMRS